MVVENFKDEVAVYRRFNRQGRLMPEGLNYLSSWIASDLKKCFQLMETEDVTLFDEWIANWQDLVDFEVIPVITSTEAAKKISPQL